MKLFSPLPAGARLLMEQLPGLIEKTFPIPRRFAHKLPRDVAELSSLFTSRREEKDASYLGRPNLLSAYLRYFLPWNVYRLCRLLPFLDISLTNGDAVIDLGSGPLSFVLALWISRPELRSLDLEFRCVDKTPAALDAGKKLFEAMVSSFESGDADAATEEKSRWTIKTIRGEIRNNGTLSAVIRGKEAALVGAVNVYNEIFWKISPADRNALQSLAARSAAALGALSAENGLILAAEPGIPRSGEFISMLRAAFLEQGFKIESPCPHDGACPYPGGVSAAKGKAKWCHFSFDTEDAPEKLARLSAVAGIPKDRGVMSFLFAAKKSGAEMKRAPRAAGGKIAANPEKTGKLTARIISDAFPVGNKTGRYGCSSLGAVLALGGGKEDGLFDSGAVVELKMPGGKDPKSGALLGNL